MRSGLVKVPSPRLDLALGVGQIQKPMHVQTFIAEPTVERFDKGIVCGLASAAEVQGHPVDVGPVIQCFRDEFGASQD